jgi:hypothetical protein
MEAKTMTCDSQTPDTGLTWLDLARHIAAMTPEQKRRPVYVCDSDTGHITTPGVVRAEGDLPNEAVQFLHGDAPIIPAGSFHLALDVATPVAPAHPADGLVLVALDLDDGQEPPADFETATGVYYQLSEVEDVGEGRRMAWYFQQEPPARNRSGHRGRMRARPGRPPTPAGGARRPRHADLPVGLHR